MTTETNAERLEGFRKQIKFLDDSADMEDYHRLVDTLKNMYEDGELSWIVKYAKEQAERAQELKGQSDVFVRECAEKLRMVNGYYDELKRENDRLREALKFYADEESYEVNTGDQWEPILPVLQDDGKKARQALKGE